MFTKLNLLNYSAFYRYLYSLVKKRSTKSIFRSEYKSLQGAEISVISIVRYWWLEIIFLYNEIKIKECAA
ncbi:hypothetical protein D1BOALGB6SA_3842 [Olavius sp. associated proteobacterium Delta 1]|nr:hypothetical protein D1BOALGB6SA_3842 [Olavius sp. associated proteobacterium Delta 1]